jgi:hypothetical protein
MATHEMHAQEHEIHMRTREIHAQACGDHVAARGGWNRAVKTSTSSWDDEEDPGGAHRSCGGTKVYKSSLEKTEAEHHRRTENSPITGVKKGQRGLTRQGKVDQRWLNNDTGAHGKKRKEKRRNDNRWGVRNGRTRWKGRGEEGENKISPPSPEKNHTEAVEKPH